MALKAANTLIQIRLVVIPLEKKEQCKNYNYSSLSGYRTQKYRKTNK